MKATNITIAIRHAILTVIAVISVFASQVVWAQTTAVPPTASSSVVVVSHNPTALSGVPPAIRNMITTFDLTRDRFLANQEVLYTQLRHATTQEEREQIRLQLQANRQSFLATLNGFRNQLKDELTALKGKISHEEFLRVIDAAKNASSEGGLGHHRGH
jgi:hypothetical protein